MSQIEIPRAELGRTKSFLSYDTLEKVNSIDSERQFRYHPIDEYFAPSVEFYNRALFFGIDRNSANSICREIRRKGYLGLVEIETINLIPGVNQIRGRPVISA